MSPNPYMTTVDASEPIRCPHWSEDAPRHECIGCRMHGICEAARNRFGIEVEQEQGK